MAARAEVSLTQQGIERLFRELIQKMAQQGKVVISQAEAYYHSLIYLVFFYLGQYTASEVNTNDRRLDCVVQTPTHIYILEFKLDQNADEALQQIKDKGYGDKYAADPRPKVLLGINFSREQKTVEGWLVEEDDKMTNRQ
ncbi:MAG: PD-(D/E)XK nuclease domain-containing protein [Caldilineaceae bacterium]